MQLRVETGEERQEHMAALSAALGPHVLAAAARVRRPPFPSHTRWLCVRSFFNPPPTAYRHILAIPYTHSPAPRRIRQPLDAFASPYAHSPAPTRIRHHLHAFAIPYTHSPAPTRIRHPPFASWPSHGRGP